MTDISKFKDLYVSESEDQLQILNENLLILEKGINNGESVDSLKNILDVLMRASHTIKGSSATMNFVDMAYLAHVMEDVYDGARNNTVKLTSEMINYAFLAIDKLEESLNLIKGTNVELHLKDIANEIKKATGVNTEGIGKSKRNNDLNDGNQINNKKVESKKNDNIVEKSVFKSELSVGVEKINSERDEVDEAVKKINYIKVPIKRLDTLMDLVEELVIDKMVLQRIGLKNKELHEVIDHVGLLIQSLQYEVMQARLVPVEQVFARFPRMVRDLSKKQGKKVEFFVSGAELELDRSIVDKLGEPLVHLLRNAIDHGIKTEGYVKLEAKRDRENALIIVENNDQSINLEMVKRVAVRKGLVSTKDIEVMSDQEVIGLIFQQLSTNEKVTEISGRGVGLSVVKTFAESAGGRVIVENLSPGVRFTLELPLTLAIINSLLVSIGGLIYAIPFSNINRSVTVAAKNIKRMADDKVAIVDDTKVSLVDLREKFGSAVVDDYSNLVVVIVKKGEESIGLVVDQLIGEQEVTVKALPPILRGVKGFSGSTILGDGRTILILDVVNLLLVNFKK